MAKGMDKIVHGSSFKDCALYIDDDGKAEWVAGTIPDAPINEITAEFVALSETRSDIEKPVWHESIRLPAGETLTNEQWGRLAERFMEEMGFPEGAQWYAKTHKDPEGHHIHIEANRVLPDGSVYASSHESMKATKVIQRLENEFDLTPTPGPGEKQSQSKTGKSRATRQEINKAVRTNEAPHRTFMQSQIDLALQGKPTPEEFIETLKEAGINVVPNIASTGRMNGFSFETDGLAFSGSKLGQKYKWKALEKKLDYQPERDTHYLMEIKHEHQNAESTADDRQSENTAGPEGSINRGNGRDGEQLGRDSHRNGRYDQGRAEDHRGAERRPGESVENTPGQSQPAQQAVERQDRAGDPQLQHAVEPDLDKRSYRSGDFNADHHPEVGLIASIRERVNAASVRFSAKLGKHTSQMQKALKRVTTQLNGIGAKAYDLAVRKDQEGGKSKVVYLKEGVSVDDLEKYLPKLAFENAHNGHIQIRPHDNKNYVLLDDLDSATIDEMIKQDRQPVSVIETSPGNYQAWLHVGENMSKDELTYISRAFTNHFGADTGAIGNDRWGRLAGFTNRKEKHALANGGKPFYVEADNRGLNGSYQTTERLIEDGLKLREKYREEKLQEAAERQRGYGFDTAMQQMTGKSSYHQLASKYANDPKYRKDNGEADMSRVDYAVALTMIRQGTNRHEVADAIAEHSPAAGRRSDPAKYASETAHNAGRQIDTEARQERQRSKSMNKSRGNDRGFEPGM